MAIPICLPGSNGMCIIRESRYRRIGLNRAQTINSHFGVKDIRRAVRFFALMALAAQ